MANTCLLPMQTAGASESLQKGTIFGIGVSFCGSQNMYGPVQLRFVTCMINWLLSYSETISVLPPNDVCGQEEI